MKPIQMNNNKDQEQSPATEGVSQSNPTATPINNQPEAKKRSNQPKNSSPPEGKGDNGTHKKGQSAHHHTELQRQLAAAQHSIKTQEEEYHKLHESYLRSRADFENWRKRLSREKEDAVTYANSQLLLDIVGVLDNFERAMHAAPATNKEQPEAENSSASEVVAILNGIALIEREWVSMLGKKWGLTRLQTVGKPFDPNLHEAVAMEEVEGVAHQTVVAEFQSGYLLHSRLLRPAKVKVHLPKEESTKETDKK